MMEGVDWGTWYQFHDLRPRLPLLSAVLDGARWLDSYPVLGLLLLAALAWLGMGRHWRPALVLVGLVLAGIALTGLVQLIVPRERPPDWDHSGLIRGSFPSGRALLAVLLYGTLALLLAQRLWTWRALPFALAAFLVLLAGTSQLYWGGHFLSDVLAGWAAGLALLLAECGLIGLWSSSQPTIRGAGS
jgi:membrane-associated phospholipid phosphatase